MSLEYRKCRGSPRTSQMPWSFSRQRSAAVSAQVTRKRRDVVVDVAELAVRRYAASSSSPYTSICRWFHAPFPTRTGRLSRQPRRCGRVALGQVVLTADTKHDLQRAVRASEGAAVAGRRRSRSASSGQAATHRAPMVRRRVAYPGVAVVPVALAADVLGQRGRGGGDDRAARLEGQRLQHPAAVVHQVAPRPVVGLVQAGPRLPGDDRVSSRAASSAWSQTRAESPPKSSGAVPKSRVSPGLAA